MADEVETSAQRVRYHLRRPLAGSRNLLMTTAGNTVSETVPLDALASHVGATGGNRFAEGMAVTVAAPTLAGALHA